MDPVSNVDRLVLLLRQRLMERSKSEPVRKTGRAAERRGLDNVQALAAVESVDDRQLKRALIQNLLAEQFGAGLINEAKFQQVVDRVTETLESDTAAAGLLSRVVTELRASAR
jgi:hypothetical protein